MAKLEIIETPVKPVKLNKKDPEAADKAVRGLVSEELKKAPPKTKTKAQSKTKKKTVGKKRASKKAREAHVTRPTAEEQQKILDRRWFVWDLYKAGASVRQISQHLTEKKIDGASVGTVHADIQWCLNFHTDDLALDIEQHRARELAILMDVHFTYYPLMKKTAFNVLGEDKTDAAKIVLAASKQRSSLLHLDKKPVEVNLTADELFAKLLGISTDQLPLTDGNESQN